MGRFTYFIWYRYACVCPLYTLIMSYWASRCISPLECLYPHLTHQTVYLVSSCIISSRPEFSKDLSTAIEGIAQMNLVDLKHEFHISLADRCWCVIVSWSGNLQKYALTSHRQFVLFIDHRFVLVSFMRPSACDKNYSPSTTSQSWREVPWLSVPNRSFKHCRIHPVHAPTTAYSIL